MEFKIGAGIEMTEDLELEGVFGTKKTAKKGDKGFVDKNGLVHFITGKAAGAIIKVSDSEMSEEFDHENIAKLIYRRLNIKYGLEEIFVDYDIEEKEFIEEIEDVLSEIF